MPAGKQFRPPVDRFEHGWEGPSLHWLRDHRRFAYVQVDRGHQRYRLIEIDSHTGAVRNIIDEKSATFIWTAHKDRKSTRLNSSHLVISYAVFCLKKKNYDVLAHLHA